MSESASSLLASSKSSSSSESSSLEMTISASLSSDTISIVFLPLPEAPAVFDDLRDEAFESTALPLPLSAFADAPLPASKGSSPAHARSFAASASSFFQAASSAFVLASFVLLRGTYSRVFFRRGLRIGSLEALTREEIGTSLRFENVS